MQTNGHNISILNVQSLLNGDDHYVIPVYQRNYAWQEAQIAQLIQDIIDYIPLSGAQDYYIGTLVAYQRKRGTNIFYETIDGQQRLTTLTLLAFAIRHNHKEVNLAWYKKVNLEFDSRKSSSDTLHCIYMYGEVEGSADSRNDNIVNGYDLCTELLQKKLEENSLGILQFSHYLFNRVQILRVTVPADTDLNHYFEIMNNRGEQLEKHEILKSKFLELLNNFVFEERELALATFNLVWEACSNMEKYLQYGFSVPQRHALFGVNDWNSLQPIDFDDLKQKLRTSLLTVADTNQFSLKEIIVGKAIKPSLFKTEDAPDRFNAVINFPNFLLHVLRIYTKKDIPLDDKRLIATFESEMKAAGDKLKFAQEFGYELLRCKFLFDKYIIKREFIGGIDRWSLKRLKWYKEDKVGYVNTFGAENDEANDDNRSILMLLSMFHVSTPTLVYKHWLNAALYHVMKKNDFLDSTRYKKYLIAIVRSFIFDRFLSNGVTKEYFDIIYNTHGTVERNPDDINTNRLVFEERIDNIIFNYLDYLLWDQYKSLKNKLVNEFEFSFRSSVEHYYPRNPMPGYRQLKGEALDSFGNLCLISHSKNSRLSNQPPIAKQSHYKKQALDSMKQWIMMKYNADEWNEISIDEHGKQMIELLIRDLNSEFEVEASIASDNKAIRWFNQFKNDHDNKSLLARAIFCFGEIASREGSSKYLDDSYPRYHLYNWDYIKDSDAFKSFCSFVTSENPSSLSAVIQHQLGTSSELQNDYYRYVFVKYPEIWSYCQQGYFSWVRDGEQIILHQRERNSEGVVRDLLIQILALWFKKSYKVDVDESREDFSIGLIYDTVEECFAFVTDGSKRGELSIDCIEPGKMKCHIIPNRNASNNSFVQGLNAYGWQNSYENCYQKGSSATLAVLSMNYEEDLNKIKMKIESIIKNGLGIKCDFVGLINR